MRIGLVIEYFDQRRGGAEHWTFQLAQRLLKQGYELHVVSMGFGPEALRMPITRHQIPEAPTRMGRAAAAERKLRSLSLDVIHDVGLGWYNDVFQSQDGSRLAQFDRKLLALPPWLRPVKRQMFRVLPRYRNFRRLVGRQFADHGQIMLAVSQMVADDYQSYHGVPEEQIRVVYNGVDTQRFSPDHRESHRQSTREKLVSRADEVLFLFVGHDFRRKGLATAIRATGRLADEGHPVRLVVAGKQSTGLYVRLARRCGAERAVTFAGCVADPVPYYAAADAYVLPTFYDPCSLGVMEALAFGLPSLTTQANGAAEVLADDVNGFVLADPNDFMQLAAQMRALLDASTRRRMGKAARTSALGYTLDRSCQQIIDIYHTIPGSQRRQRAA